MAWKNNSTDNLHIIGSVSPNISDEKLPTQKQILQYLYYCSRKLQLNKTACRNKVLDRIQEIWSITEIPSIRRDKCLSKLVSLELEYDTVMRNTSRQNNKTKEEQFSHKIDQLFDISHKHQLETADDQNKIFLEDQRSNRYYQTNEIKKIRLGLRSGI